MNFNSYSERGLLADLITILFHDSIQKSIRDNIVDIKKRIRINDRRINVDVRYKPMLDNILYPVGFPWTDKKYIKRIKRIIMLVSLMELQRWELFRGLNRLKTIKKTFKKVPTEGFPGLTRRNIVEKLLNILTRLNKLIPNLNKDNEGRNRGVFRNNDTIAGLQEDDNYKFFIDDPILINNSETRDWIPDITASYISKVKYLKNKKNYWVYVIYMLISCIKFTVYLSSLTKDDGTEYIDTETLRELLIFVSSMKINIDNIYTILNKARNSVRKQIHKIKVLNIKDFD